jgi:CheY-like chemotaxis protein
MTQPLRLLIVDDSKGDVGLLLEAVRSGGYKPEYEVVDTEPAMRAALGKQDWDLITSDHSMPQFNAPRHWRLPVNCVQTCPSLLFPGRLI